MLPGSNPNPFDYEPSLDEHRPLADMGDALCFLEEIEFAMRHVPIKQEPRTPEEQKAVERFSTYWTWIRDVLRQSGRRSDD